MQAWFESLLLRGNLVLFTAAAIAVWYFGVRIAEQADVIAQRTGLGRVVLGALLLGGVTSLPEYVIYLEAKREPRDIGLTN